MYKSKKPYLYGTGRRKSSVARVHLFPNGTGSITINGRDIDDYFGLETLKLIVRQPLATTDTLGKTAAAAATLLRGKHKPEFTPHADCGDFVVIVNAQKAVLTGKKLEQKYYRTHSGWVGGLKETKYRLLMQQKPELAMQVAIRGMLPRNIITKDSLSRLHIYRGAEHPHTAQKPEAWAAN